MDVLVVTLQKNLFVGAFQQVINDATNPSVVPRSEDVKRDRKVYLHRAYIAQGRYNPPLNEIADNEAVELQAVKTLAKYLSSTDSAVKDEAVQNTHRLVEQGSSALLATIAGTVFSNDGLYDEVLKVVQPFPRDLECLALAIQTYLRIDRADLAKKEIASIKTWADDATVAQLIEAWQNLYSGSDDKVNEAFYTFDEVSASTLATPHLLTGKAVCKMVAGKFVEAEELLIEALNRNSNDPETLVNLIVCGNATGKPADVVARYLSQLQDSSPNHLFLKELTLKESLFDRSSQRYQ